MALDLKSAMVSAPREARLLPRVAAGEPGAVRECVERYGGLVWSISRRYAEGREDAEDAVQEIFIDLWRSAGRFDERVAGEATFVAMIARRRLIDRRRARGRRPELVGEKGEVTAGGTTLDTMLDAQIAAREMENLRPEQREALELSIWKDLSHSEIAERMGVPLGTVKSYLRRGLLQLRFALSMGRAV